MDTMSDGDLVRDQLTQLRSSAVFSRSKRLYEMLAFLVEETIAGRGQTLKELVVGAAMYGRHAPYDPCINSTVRVEARRLRRKLLEYYEGPGRDAPFRIVLPGGGYRPVFEPTGAAGGCGAQAARCQDGLVNLAVMPFRALSSVNDDLADGLTDELMHVLARATTLRLAPRLAVFQYAQGVFSLREAANVLGVRAMLHGTLRMLPTQARLSLELSDAGGALIWSERLDAPAGETPLDEESLAERVVSHLPGWFLRSRTPRPLALVS